MDEQAGGGSTEIPKMPLGAGGTRIERDHCPIEDMSRDLSTTLAKCYLDESPLKSASRG